MVSMISHGGLPQKKKKRHEFCKTGVLGRHRGVGGVKLGIEIFICNFLYL